MTEHAIQSEIFRAIGSRADVRLFRNNTAGAWAGEVIGRTPHSITLLNPYPIHAGLFKGSADLIGIVAPTGRFLSLEIKSATGRPRPEQIVWRDNILRFGGIAGIVRSVDEALVLLP